MTMLGMDNYDHIPTFPAVIISGLRLIKNLPHFRPLQDSKNPMQSIYGNTLLETG